MPRDEKYLIPSTSSAESCSEAHAAQGPCKIGAKNSGRGGGRKRCGWGGGGKGGGLLHALEHLARKLSQGFLCQSARAGEAKVVKLYKLDDIAFGSVPLRIREDRVVAVEVAHVGKIGVAHADHQHRERKTGRRDQGCPCLLHVVNDAIRDDQEQCIRLLVVLHMPGCHGCKQECTMSDARESSSHTCSNLRRGGALSASLTLYAPSPPCPSPSVFGYRFVHVSHPKLHG